MKNKDAVIPALKQALEAFDGVAAAYLFGSMVEDDPVVNDLDILVLPYPDADRDALYFDLYERIARALPEAPRADILFFDLDEADPEVLYNAVKQGTLLKDESTDLLTDQIERLSVFFLENEFLIQNERQLRREMLEESRGISTQNQSPTE